MHDNARPHVAQVCQDYLRAHNVQVLATIFPGHESYWTLVRSSGSESALTKPASAKPCSVTTSADWRVAPLSSVSHQSFNNVDVSPGSGSKAREWVIHPLLRKHINSNFCVRRKSDFRCFERSRLRTYVLFLIFLLFTLARVCWELVNQQIWG